MTDAEMRPVTAASLGGSANDVAGGHFADFHKYVRALYICVVLNSGEQLFISDHAFCPLFSRAKCGCLGICAYEGAEIVADLCAPIDRALKGRFDFIFDGSCLDNVFDP